MQDSRVLTYMEHHDLNTLFPELEGALLRYQPSDPYEFIVGCVRSVQQKKKESRDPPLYSQLFEEYASQNLELNSVAGTQRNVPSTTTSGQISEPSNNNKRRKRQRSEEDTLMEIRTPPYFTTHHPPGQNFDQYVPHQHTDETLVHHRRTTLPPSPPNNHQLPQSARNNHSRAISPRKGRRMSVSAESITPTANINERKIIYKSDEAKKRINEATTLNLLFKNLDRETKQHVVDAMFEKSVMANDIVIRQGDEGDYFYAIEHGIFEIFVNGQLVLEVGNGGSFGELALMYNTPRAATVRAKTDGTLWAVGRETFLLTITSSVYRKRSAYEEFLRSVSFLTTLDQSEFSKLADALEPNNFEDGDTIISQGDPGEYFYIIEQGSVNVSKITDMGTEQQLPSLTVGDYFGELALLNEQPRKATVVSRGPVRLAALRRDAFVRLLGPVMEIFRRNAAEYNLNQQNTTGQTRQESGENHVPSQTGSGDEIMAVDDEPSPVTSISSTRSNKKSGYSGAGGVDVL
ncbi:9912_t:CDS:2 [Funneliformis geosporum]|uniref:cAMP-dependent protein kinase regulatory subunit n=1 Tax=Funneliformis geosporum TaxID=1117311 RepID=A0A9W4WVK5_9GLOM|nr:20083_t:CDS:2 [Funneliformis geosporum]CAI2166961.1 9912_t:CDS:2 [Funneliformis geosporum]